MLNDFHKLRFGWIDNHHDVHIVSSKKATNGKRLVGLREPSRVSDRARDAAQGLTADGSPI
jgi:hypothetical protein